MEDQNMERLDRVVTTALAADGLHFELQEGSTEKLRVYALIFGTDDGGDHAYQIKIVDCD